MISLNELFQFPGCFHRPHMRRYSLHGETSGEVAAVIVEAVKTVEAVKAVEALEKINT